MGAIVEFTGGLRCEACARQVDPIRARDFPVGVLCGFCLAARLRKKLNLVAGESSVPPHHVPTD